MPDRLHQVGFAQPDAAVDKQRVVYLCRFHGDRLARGKRHAAVGSDDELLEAVLGDEFGAETVIVLIEGEPQDVMAPENLDILDKFEQDFIKDEDRIHSILGPVTILKEAERIQGSSGPYARPTVLMSSVETVLAWLIPGSK